MGRCQTLQTVAYKQAETRKGSGMKEHMHGLDFEAIPAAACAFAGGTVDLGDNGENAKTAPVRLKARSGQPIEHWFWGRVVHDLAGMRLNKSRLTIDYAHNDSEVLGYLNHFDTESGDLVASGALIPFADDDRASEVLFKMRQGVPYEASIFFGGDGIKVQEIGDGEVSPVNGYDFEGPGIIIREWPLRGVAICPYGADANTETAALSKGPSFAATRWTASRGDEEMSEEVGAVEVQEQQEVAAEAAPVEELSVEAEATTTEAGEQSQGAEAKGEQPTALESATADAVRAQLAAVEADKAHALKRAEEAEAKLSEKSDELAGSIDALKETTEALNAVTAERDELRQKLDAIEKGAKPVSAAPAPKDDSELTPWQKAQRRK